jgi:hypothetical protein
MFAGISGDKFKDKDSDELSLHIITSIDGMRNENQSLKKIMRRFSFII